LSKLPKEIVDQLSMFGLIEARNGLYGFRDLAAARQVAGLLAAGTGLSVITKSLHEIRKWLPDAGLSNLKLFFGIVRPHPCRTDEDDDEEGASQQECEELRQACLHKEELGEDGEGALKRKNSRRQCVANARQFGSS
jgi:hypothetical protein